MGVAVLWAGMFIVRWLFRLGERNKKSYLVALVLVAQHQGVAAFACHCHLRCIERGVDCFPYGGYVCARTHACVCACVCVYPVGWSSQDTLCELILSFPRVDSGDLTQVFRLARKHPAHCVTLMLVLGRHFHETISHEDKLPWRKMTLTDMSALHHLCLGLVYIWFLPFGKGVYQSHCCESFRF